MRSYSNVTAVLLHMDGTLVDSDTATTRAWATWAREYGVDVGDGPAIMCGRPVPTTVATLRPDLGDDAIAAAAAARQLDLQRDDLGDVVPTRRGHRLAAAFDRLGTPSPGSDGPRAAAGARW